MGQRPEHRRPAPSTLTGLTANELGWAGVGQYNDLANPCALMVYMGAIANGGTAAVPPAGAQDGERPGLPSLPALPRHTKKLVEGDTAAALAELMAHNVTAQYGASRFPNMDVCAKSGTTEVGAARPPTPGSPASSATRRPLRLRGAGGERRLRRGRGGFRGGQGAGRCGQRILKAGPRRAAKPCAGGVLIAAPVRCAGARRGSPPPPPAPERARGGGIGQSPPPRSW